MPFIDNRGKPIDPDHPFANPCIVFGAKRPDSSAKPSTATNAENASTSPGWTREESLAQMKMLDEMDAYVRELNEQDRQKEQSAPAANASTSPGLTNEEMDQQVSLGKSIDERLAQIGKGAWPPAAPTSPKDTDK